MDNCLSKLSNAKLNSVLTSGQPEDLNRERQETGTPSSDSNGQSRVGPVKLPGNPSKTRIISQDNGCPSLFVPSDLEDDLPRNKGNPLWKVIFKVNSTVPQPESYNEDILCDLTEKFNNDELCDRKINLNLSKAINELWRKKLIPKKCENKSK